MNAVRSISYAPESILPPSRRPQPIADRSPEWTLCRRLNAIPIADNAALQRLTERGRVRPDDYLVSLELDVCVQAKEIAELDAVFRKATACLLGKVSRGLVCVALALVWLLPLLGSLMLVSAIAIAILSFRTTRRSQIYRIYTSSTGDEGVLAARPA